MAVTGKVFNPRLTFQYLIEIDGFEAGMASSVQIPQPTLGTIEHSSGGLGYSIKTTGGGISWSNLQIEKIMHSEKSDDFAWNWMISQVNPFTRKVGLPENYKKVVTIHHLDGEGNPIQTWSFGGCRISEISMSKSDAINRDEKVIESLTITVDTRIK